MTWFLVGAALVVLTLLWLSWTASRLDRLQGRVESARATMDAQLFRRSHVTSALAARAEATGVLPRPVTASLQARARAAADATPEQREQAENALSVRLRDLLEDDAVVRDLRADPSTAKLLADLEESSRRVAYARRFHNDAVRHTLMVRRTRRVKWFRLGGGSAAPEYFEIEDGLPASY